MATKAPVKPVTKEAKPEGIYSKINFAIEQAPWCCGLGVVGNFEEEADYRNWPDRAVKVPKPFKTRNQQAKECLQRIYTDNVEHDGGGGYGQLMATFVSKYVGTNEYAQFPKLVEAMRKDGWTEVARWINPNHGNELIMLTKTLEDVIKRRLEEEGFNEDYDEEDYPW